MTAKGNTPVPDVAGTDRTLSVAIRRQLGTFTLDAAFTMDDGITALLGASGSGKTLTLRAIAGLLRPDSGRIRIGGHTVFDHDQRVDVPARLRRVGYVMQHYALFPHLTVAQNIGFGLHRLSTGERHARVAELLAMVQLDAFAGHMPRALSGGQQQRVAVARALAPGPRLVLLDEPLAALDRPLRTAIGAELRRMHEATGTPMILVTHDPEEATRIADRIVQIDGGSMG